MSAAGAFNFNEDGSTDGDVMSEDQISLVSSAYAVASSTIASTETGEAYDTYFAAEIGNITSVDQLMSDDKLVGYLRIAYGLSDDESDSYISAALKSADIAEAIGLSDLHDAFNFDEDGALADGDTAQTSDQTATTTAAFDENYQVLVANASTEDATDNYTTRIASVTSIDGFLVSNDDDDDDDNDDLPELWEMALRAYDIDPDSVSRSEVRKILESDPADSKSYVNSLDDDRFVAFRKAFNFDDNGDVTVPLQAMSESVVDDYVAYYKQNKIRYLEGDELTEATDAANDEITYFREQMATITTASEFLADDRLVSFALEAKGLDPDDVTSDELEKMFSSDLDDDKSYVNKLDDNRFAELVGSFNFDQDGNISADPTGTVQQRGDVLETIDSYVRLTLEDDGATATPACALPSISNARRRRFRTPMTFWATARSLSSLRRPSTCPVTSRTWTSTSKPRWSTISST